MRTMTLPCECGLPVRARMSDPAPGLREHQATPEHQAYRRGPTVIGTFVLGPCPCVRCRELLRWNGWAWQGADGLRHRCAA
jgi:hypothetical protein